MSFCSLIAHFFLPLSNIPSLLYGCSTVCLYIYLLKDTLVAPNLWQLWIKLPWIFLCWLLCGCNIKEHNCWSYGKSIFSFVKKLPNCFPKWLYSHQQWMRTSPIDVSCIRLIAGAAQFDYVFTVFLSAVSVNYRSIVGVLKAPTIIVDWLISPCSCISFASHILMLCC